MAQSYPVVYYACPCTDISEPFQELSSGELTTEEQEEQTFNPYSPRANYALYPLEHLLFCNECHEIRCPRCYSEEALSYFCPRCLTERQSAEVRRESNRCPQSCHECPICSAPLLVNRFEPSETASVPDQQPRNNTFILSCPYCKWNSLEIGIKFEKGVNISGQLGNIKNGGELIDTAKNEEPGVTRPTSQDAARFFDLATFYKNQIEDSTTKPSFRTSPGHLSRLLSTHGIKGLKREIKPLPPMREAVEEAEGLTVFDEESDNNIIDKMGELGWDGITNAEQRLYQTDTARFFSDLRPIATTLHSKRVKRCRNCRRQLVRPDIKKGSTRYIIKLVALKYIPRVTLRPFDSTTNLDRLAPITATQFLLNFRNPLFDSVKVTLATPPTTPGKVASKVTILCPQFDIGPNIESFDNVLEVGGKKKGEVIPTIGQQPEAGKVWEKGRNWTTVVLEIVPGELTQESADKPRGSGRGDEDMIEVPIFVRLEYETEAPPSNSYVGGAGDKAEQKARVQREMAFWCVLGIGRIKAIGT